MSTSRIIRKFERFLFKGIPEQPETIYERDGHTLAAIRETGKSSVESSSDEDDDYLVLGVFKYDFEQQKQIYISKI